MIRETSIEAFNKIRDEGLLSNRRMQVYTVLFENGPLTGNEVFELLKNEYNIQFKNAPSIVSRLGELRNMGVVKEVGKKLCSISGMTVILWDVTKNLPVKFDRPTCYTCPTCNGSGKISEHQAKLF